MRTQIPSTQALRVFEVAARYLNCTHAAQELCLTTSAVSKQLQSLEDSIGIELFIRSKHGLLLTEAGQLYLDCIKPAMSKLMEAGVRVTRQQLRPQELQIRLLPAFADRWLLSRYSTFCDANPDVRIQFNTSLLPDETFPFTFDAYVCLGEGVWPGCVAEYICGSELVLVASPKLFERHPAVQSPAELLDFTLFEHTEVPQVWSQAFEILGLKPERPSHIVQWDFYSVIIRSACVGHGLALIPRCFITEELTAGELVQVLDHRQISSYGYYFVVSEGREDDVSIARFRDWLRSRKADGERPMAEVTATGAAIERSVEAIPFGNDRVQRFAVRRQDRTLS